MLPPATEAEGGTGTGSPGIAVAVSGGSDSMALTLLLQEWAQAHGWIIYGLHVDHGLRPESPREAAQVQGWLEARAISCHVLTPSSPLQAGGNLQARARTLRYGLMQRWCARHGVTYVATGHQAEDQAVTVLMRLARGSGVDGLAGIPTVSPMGPITVIRPLLAQARASLRDYLERRGQPWLEDPSNASPRYGRNRMAALLPALAAEGVTPARLGQAGAHMARTREALEQRTTAWIDAHSLRPSDVLARFDAVTYAALPEELALRVVRTLLQRLHPGGGAIRMESLGPIVAAMQQLPPSRPHHALHGCLVRYHRGQWWLMREPGRSPPPVPVGAGSGASTLTRWDEGRCMAAPAQAQMRSAAPLWLGMLGARGLAQLRRRGVTAPRWPALALKSLPTLFYLEEPWLVPHILFDACRADGWHRGGSVVTSCRLSCEFP